MSNFFAKIGYTLMWAFGIPKYSLEEKFKEYYRVGLLITIIGIVAMVIVILLFIWVLKKKVKKQELLDNALRVIRYTEIENNEVEDER